MQQPNIAPPAKIVLERHAPVGDEAWLEQWAADVVRSADLTGALQSSSVVTQTSGGTLVLLRFSGQVELDRWQASPEVAELLHHGETPGAGRGPVVRTGLETWFTVPGRPPLPLPPPTWKMALLTWLALLPQVLLFAVLLPPAVPLFLRGVISTAIPVTLLSWVVMPELTKILYPWLYRGRGV